MNEGDYRESARQIGEILREARKDKDISQQQMALALPYSEAFISGIENGNQDGFDRVRFLMDAAGMLGGDDLIFRLLKHHPLWTAIMPSVPVLTPSKATQALALALEEFEISRGRYNLMKIGYDDRVSSAEVARLPRLMESVEQIMTAALAVLFNSELGKYRKEG